MKRVIGYLRVSTETQDIKRQKVLIREYCEKQGFELVRFISDDGVSGTKGVTDREGYNSLLNISSSECDLVAITEFSRLTREESMLTAAGNVKKIVDNGVDIIILNTDKRISRGFDKEIMTLFFMILESSMAWQERCKISERMTSGKYSKALRCPLHLTGGAPLYGYRSVDTILAIDEEKAPIVREIFQKYACGWSSLDIVRWAKSVDSDKKWNAGNFMKIITNELYRGLYSVTIQGRSIEKHYPELQIISDELWEQVQIKRLANKKQKTTGNPIQADALLRDVLKCGCCSSSYSVWKNNQKQFYKCVGRNNRLMENNCSDNAYIDQNRVESIIWHAISSQAILTQIKNNSVGALEKNTAELKTLQEKKGLLEQDVLNAQEEWERYFERAIRYNISVDKMDTFKSDIDARTEQAEKEIKRIENEIRHITQINGHLTHFDEKAYIFLTREINADRAQKKRLINDFVKCIRVYNYSGFVLLDLERFDGEHQYIFLEKLKKGGDFGLYYMVMGHYMKFSDGVFVRDGERKSAVDLFKWMRYDENQSFRCHVNE